MKEFVKPSHKPIKDYYAQVKRLRSRKVKHETGLRNAFHNLLDHAGRKAGWQLIAEEHLPGSASRPDGTLKDEFDIPRGYWEAKDDGDKLMSAVASKVKAGYPLTNILFENTQSACLYQSGQCVLTVELADPDKLCMLLNTFLSYREPAHEDFETAVEDFRLKVPELAKGLVKKIDEAHRSNKPFEKAFVAFFDLCRQSLNPNLSRAAVDEMLVQHLLTERLFRTIFNNPDFTRRNVIAAEVEKVIDELTKHTFNKQEFFQHLDVFYRAIESAAATLPDFTSKQHFLNTVYERFFQGYCVKTADTHGIVYTPQPIVDFMCASVQHVLKEEFGQELGDANVHVLDPCTGTGNFVVNLLRRVPRRKLDEAYRSHFFANEVMLMPYYIAAMNIEHAYVELTGRYEPFEGLCFVDTLDLGEREQQSLGFMVEKNSERVERQKRSPIFVVIGNPPYNANQLNENDNNKNRKYPAVDQRIRSTYGKLGSATKSKYEDPYVRFFRWASDRLGNADGVVCFVTNNSFVHDTATDGLQRYLPREFTAVYHLDLQGNVRKNQTLSGTQYNVFGIQLGVGITIAVRRKASIRRIIKYKAVPLKWHRRDKLKWLATVHNIAGVDWQIIRPQGQGSWFRARGHTEFGSFLAMGTKEAKGATSALGLDVVFKTFSLGISTNRDDVVYGFDRDHLLNRVRQFCDSYNSELDRFVRQRPDPKTLDDWLDTSAVKWSRNLKNELKRHRALTFRPGNERWSLYRPFTQKLLYLSDIAVDEPGLMKQFMPGHEAEIANTLILTPTLGTRGKSWLPFASKRIPNLNMTSVDACQCFPYYIFDEDGDNQRENITDTALKVFRRHYATSRIQKIDIFNYVYGMLHHAGYRRAFADCLRKELPRIPLSATLDDFKAIRDAGKELAELHVGYEQVKPFELEWIDRSGIGKGINFRVEKMKLSPDKRDVIVNETLTLRGVPPEVFEYRLGNRSAVEWVIDQYRVDRDAAGNITSDPNRDPPEDRYIIDLVGKVIAVSLRTVELVKSLPKSYGGPPRHDVLSAGATQDVTKAAAEPSAVQSEAVRGALRPQRRGKQMRLDE